MVPILDSCMICGVVAELLRKFSRVYRVPSDKNAFVDDLSERYNELPRWNVSSTRAARDWEVDTFAALFNLLDSTSLKRGI